MDCVLIVLDEPKKCAYVYVAVLAIENILLKH